MSKNPKMSVIIITSDNYQTIRQTMRYLQAQTVSEQLEVVIVAPSTEQLNANDNANSVFNNVQIVAVGEEVTVPAARSAGILKAVAPVVVFAEDHCFPAPGWAKALIEAHQHPWAVVGPVFRNANPNGMFSWANLLLNFGRWVEPVESGVVEGVAWHNGAYKKSLLLEYGPRLPYWLETEGLLHQDLRLKGYQIYLETGAVVYHQNIDYAGSSFYAEYHSGRLFGANRSPNWSILKKMVYIAGSPLIPFWRLPGVIKKAKQVTQRKLSAKILPAIFWGLIAHTIGEIMGYALGVGNSSKIKSSLELHRERFVKPADVKKGAILAQ